MIGTHVHVTQNSTHACCGPSTLRDLKLDACSLRRYRRSIRIYAAARNERRNSVEFDDANRQNDVGCIEDSGLEIESSQPALSLSRRGAIMGVAAASSPGILNLPQVQRQVGRFSAMSIRASASTLETATKQNVGAAASKSQTYVGLNSGHHMPLIGWGTSQATGDECIKATKAAIEAGYRHIDTAEMYKNETEIGKGLHELFKSGAVKREDLFVTSKLWTEHHPSDQVRPGLMDTLSRLQLDYVDLYLIHWPTSVKPGPKVTPPFSETWEALEKCVDEGLIKSIGVSNFSPEKIETFMPGAKIRPAVNQIEMHAHWRNDRVLKWCNQQGIHVSAYGPLSSPATVASMEKDVPNEMEDETVNEIAKKLGKTAPQVLLRWGLQHGVSVLPKSANPDHLQENMGCVGWELPDEDYQTLSNLRQHRYFTGTLAMHEDGPWRNYEELWDEKDTSEPL